MEAAWTSEMLVSNTTRGHNTDELDMKPEISDEASP
jgi:hypothetical protein